MAKAASPQTTRRGRQTAAVVSMHLDDITAASPSRPVPWPRWPSAGVREMDRLNLQFQSPLPPSRSVGLSVAVGRSGTAAATTIPGIRLRKSILLPLVMSLTRSLRMNGGRDSRRRHGRKSDKDGGFVAVPAHTQPVGCVSSPRPAASISRSVRSKTGMVWYFEIILK